MRVICTPFMRLTPYHDRCRPGAHLCCTFIVVEAERTAKANLIRRQEETAVTRSLLNTAKLMEKNPLLLRLKELEWLERLVSRRSAASISTPATARASTRPSPSSYA